MCISYSHEDSTMLELPRAVFVYIHKDLKDYNAVELFLT